MPVEMDCGFHNCFVMEESISYGVHKIIRGKTGEKITRLRNE